MATRRTPDELNKSKYNYFLAFKIALTERNADKIEQTIKTKTGNPQGDIYIRRLIELKNDALEIMCHDAVYDEKTQKYVPNSGGRAKEAAWAKNYKLNETVELIERLCRARKTFLKSEIIKICDEANKPVTYFTREELFTALNRIKELGAKIVDNLDSTIPFADYQKCETALETFNKNDLYDYLGLAKTASLSDIKATAPKKYSETRSGTDRVKQSGSSLDGLIKNIFRDQQTRQAYDRYLALKKGVWDTFAYYKQHNIKLIPIGEYEEYTQKVIDTLKVSADEAQKIIGIGCKYFNLSLEGSGDSGALETCVFCGKLTSKSAKTCIHCGAQLEKSCWNCRQPVRISSDDKPCPVCGATENMQSRFIANCRVIQTLIDNNEPELSVLEEALNDVKKVLPGYKKKSTSKIATQVRFYENQLQTRRDKAKEAEEKRRKEEERRRLEKEKEEQKRREEAEREAKRRREEARRAKRKRNRIIIISSCSSAAAVALAIFLVVLFTFLIPFWSLPVTTTAVNNEYTVTGLKSGKKDTEVLEIEESVPRMFFQKPRYVVGIGANAFSGNENLKKVILPGTINKIGAMAFANCDSLNTVIINSDAPPQIATNAFDGTNAMLYVPENSYGDYIVADGWRGYDENIFPYADGVDDSHGVLVYLAENGVFDNGKDYLMFPAYSYGSALSTVNEPTRQNYTFEGWYYKDNGIKEVGSDTRFERSTKLHAKWSPETYTITFVYGDDVVMPSDLPASYNVEQEVELPVPTRLGYIFEGWYTNAQLTGTAYPDVIPKGTKGNLTFYPKWERAEYNFKFVSVDGLVEEIRLKTGDVIDIVPARPSDGTLDGKMFIGWSTEEGSTTADFSNIIPPMENTSQTIFLYAVWVESYGDWFRYEQKWDGLWIVGTAEAWDKYPYDEKAYLYLPSIYQGEPVVGIASGAFAENTSIKAVDIPGSFTSVAENAFNGCTNLYNVFNGNSVTSVGIDAFADTGWLETKWNKEYNKPWFLTLGHVALKYNFNRTNALNVTADDFPEEITVLGYGLFYGCGEGSTGGTMVVPDRVKYIYDFAFANSGFTNFTLPAYVAYYGNSVFEGITQIGTLTLRDGTFDFEDAFKGSLEEGLKISKLAFEGEIGGAIFMNGGGKVTVNKLSGSGVGVNAVPSGLKFSSVNLYGFVRISEIDLSYNSIFAFDAGGFEIGLLNLRNNQLFDLDISYLFATNLVLVSNNLAEIICSVPNEYVKIIYMPADLDSNNRLNNLGFASNLPNLLSLDVANNNISDISGLFGLTKLKELYLGGNPVLNNSAQINRLAEEQFCENIVRLNLGGGTATRAILNVVSKCTNLEWLQIYGIGASISDITGTISQQTHANLKYLKISHNGFLNVPESLNYINTVVVDYYDFRQDDEQN